jgi:hypothetical protein
MWAACDEAKTILPTMGKIVHGFKSLIEFPPQLQSLAVQLIVVVP